MHTGTALRACGAETAAKGCMTSKVTTPHNMSHNSVSSPAAAAEAVVGTALTLATAASAGQG